MKEYSKLTEDPIVLSGAKFSALCADIKYKDRLDLMLIYLDSGSILAGVFTKSLTRSASVIWSEKIVRNSHKYVCEPYAILVNSGNANAFTGQKGHAAVKHVMKALSQSLGITLKEQSSISAYFQNLMQSYCSRMLQNMLQLGNYDFRNRCNLPSHRQNSRLIQVR